MPVLSMERTCAIKQRLNILRPCAADEFVHVANDGSSRSASRSQ
jgi:hypothetical protein